MNDTRRPAVEKRRRPPAVKEAGKLTAILVVEDSPVDRTLVDQVLGNAGGWRALHASNGREALAILEHQKPDLVLTDMMMDQMDGLALVDALRESHPSLPVILMTAYGNEDVALKALRIGAASYVSKKRLERDLIDTLDEVLASSQARRRHERLQNHLIGLESHFVLDNDPTLVRALVSQFQDDLSRLRWPDRDRVRMGIALEEAVVNGISHGNLEVTGEARQRSDKAYRALLEERRRQPPYKDRHVHASARLSPAEAVFVIRDEGPGFNPAALPDPTDPANLEKFSGRGLLLIRTFMDDVRHNRKGNEIVMIKRNPHVISQGDLPSGTESSRSSPQRGPRQERRS